VSKRIGSRYVSGRTRAWLKTKNLKLRGPVNEFEAIITDEVAISAFGGHGRLAPGTYRVTIVHDERGAPDGARLVRLDVDGEPPVRLTRVQYGLLDGTRFFERR
jgi:hypothetical protein